MIFNSFNIPKQTKRETLRTDLGPIEAIKHGPNKPWEINSPWSGEFFYGSTAAVRKRMIAIKQLNEAADNLDNFGEAPNQPVGPRAHMSSEEERRRRLKRKLDHKAKLARKHSRSTVAED